MAILYERVALIGLGLIAAGLGSLHRDLDRSTLQVRERLSGHGQ